MNKKVFNNGIILYYAFMPIIAFIIGLLKKSDSVYSYILLINLVASFIAFSYFIYLKQFKLENYQVYFLVYTILALFVSLLRGEIWKGLSKYTIESAFLVLSSTVFILVPSVRKNLINLFLIYLIVSFIHVGYQRFFTVNYILGTNLAESISNQRFNGFWGMTSNIALTYMIPLLAAFTSREYLKEGKQRLALLVIVISFLTALMSNGRAVMLYMIIIIFAFITYRNKSTINRVSKLVLFMIIFIPAFFFVSRYDKTFRDIVSNRIYRTDIPFEERSENARIENIRFFFTSKYFSLLGNGTAENKEYQTESGRRATGLLIGFLNPIYSYGILSIFYYLFWFSLIKKSINYYKLTKDGYYLALIIGFIVIGFTAGFTNLSNMQAFFLLLFFKTDYDEAITMRNNILLARSDVTQKSLNSIYRTKIT
jgi:hypothetical protein